MTIYEVQRYGKTLEWTRKLKEAEDSFSHAGEGTVMFRITGDTKRVINSK